MGPKRPRSPSQYNPKERNKIGRYYAEKKKRGERQDGAGTSRQDREPSPQYSFPEEDPDYQDLGSDFSDEGEQAMEGPGQLQAGGGIGRGPGGGGGNNGNLGTQEISSRPFGKATGVKTKTYTKSYTIYFTNGVESMNWVETSGTTTTSPFTSWNEGWSIIPWGILHSAMTPGDWIELMHCAQRIRIKSTSVELEDMIPFQETSTAAGDTLTQATASNRPNIWLFKDSTGRKLPKVNIASTRDFAHNDNFQTPYGDYTSCKLRQPTFIFNNLAPSQATYKMSALPAATKPQTIYSLTSTGKVKRLMAGGKIKEHWKNPHKTWLMSLLNTDSNENAGTPTGTTALNYQQIKNDLLGPAPEMGIGMRADGQGVMPNPVISSNNCHHYADTNLSLKEGGPPYLLIKVEPYYDTQNNALQIYMKANIHYTMTVEYEEKDHFNTFAPYNYSAARPSVTAAEFDSHGRDYQAQFGWGNEQNTAYGMNNNRHMYT
uniref:Capsid protein n=1 Tax=Motacilla cinerea parvoviridae sp. TaxID=2794518 RepID=A0A8A4XDK4_9VIRU|nr:MAG: capsid protein [Motacilla cinerea parvoviridae sp.]